MKFLFVKLILSILFIVYVITTLGQGVITVLGSGETTEQRMEGMLMKQIYVHLADRSYHKVQAAYNAWKSYTHSINPSIEARIKACKSRMRKSYVDEQPNPAEPEMVLVQGGTFDGVQ